MRLWRPGGVFYVLESGLSPEVVLPSDSSIIPSMTHARSTPEHTESRECLGRQKGGSRESEELGSQGHPIADACILGIVYKASRTGDRTALQHAPRLAVIQEPILQPLT